MSNYSQNGHLGQYAPHERMSTCQVGLGNNDQTRGHTEVTNISLESTIQSLTPRACSVLLYVALHPNSSLQEIIEGTGSTEFKANKDVKILKDKSLIEYIKTPVVKSGGISKYLYSLESKLDVAAVKEALEAFSLTAESSPTAKSQQVESLSSEPIDTAQIAKRNYSQDDLESKIKTSLSLLKRTYPSSSDSYISSFAPILELIADRNSVSMNEISQELKLRENLVHTRLQKLMSSNILSRRKDLGKPTASGRKRKEYRYFFASNSFSSSFQNTEEKDSENMSTAKASDTDYSGSVKTSNVLEKLPRLPEYNESWPDEMKAEWMKVYSRLLEKYQQ